MAATCESSPYPIVPMHFQSSIQTLSMVKASVLIGCCRQPIKSEGPRTGIVQVSSLVSQHVIYCG
jgi:hypothetical protein